MMSVSDERKRLTDYEIIALIDSFRNWQATQPAPQNDSLDNMLDFLRRTIEQGVNLGDALVTRNSDRYESLIVLAGQVNSDCARLAAYVTRMIRDHADRIDYDPAFLASGDVLGFTDIDHPDDPKARSFLARYNALFGDGFVSRSTAYFHVLNEKKPRPSALEILKTPIIASFHLAQFNLGLASDSTQIGENAWGDGKTMIDQIAAALAQAPVNGELSTLYPSNINSAVDWQQNDWIYSPDHKNWLLEGFGEPARIPPIIAPLIS